MRMAPRSGCSETGMGREERAEALRGLNLKSESKPPPPLTTAPSARKVPAHEHVTFPLGALRPQSARRLPLLGLSEAESALHYPISLTCQRTKAQPGPNRRAFKGLEIEHKWSIFES
jgi:hypothetical protein